MSTKTAKTTEGATEQATVKAAQTETLVYVGPSILGVAYHNTVFNNGVPQELQTAMDEEPAFKNLLVPIGQLAAVGSDIANKRGAAYIFYEKALQYKQSRKQ